jgi:flavin reductase
VPDPDPQPTPAARTDGATADAVRTESPGVDADAFRAALGSFATGVSVMTTVVDGEPHGMTANALSSVSLDPPLVLVCVDRDAFMAELVGRAGVFALSFLAADQEALSWHFADPDRELGVAEFDGVATRTAVTGCRILERAVGSVDCEVVQSVDAGDHVIVVGRVVAAHGDADVTPLVYVRGAYPALRT